MKQVFSTTCGRRKLEFEVGEIAKQANSAVLVRYGDTAVLVTATASKEPREGITFFPLTVDYEERLYSIGKIPGGWLRREGRPGENAILCSRLIDRSIRPLFPKDYRNDVQIIATILSVDQDNPAEFAAMMGTSLALGISDIPFAGPMAAVIVGLIDDKFVINPTVEQAAQSRLHLVVAGTRDAVVMVEAGAKEVPEETILDAIAFGHEEIKKLVAFQEDIIAEIGQTKQVVEPRVFDPELVERVHQLAETDLNNAIRVREKKEREEAIEGVKKRVLEQLEEQYPEQEAEIEDILYQLTRKLLRRMITEEGVRPDGRTSEEIRPISCRVGLLPRAHGSGLFTRGQTQVLSVTTLGAVGDMQILDDLGVEESKRYMHHYNFPPFSTGETRPLRGPNRRAIGHGALAERALTPVLPDEEEFPYTIRVVSEVLESNGSSSMASVCGSTLSLMDAGVPIKRPVAGIALGLIKEGDTITVLSDIQGLEDFHGDMDFKVAGTELGVTAIQMDVKIKGLTMETLRRGLEQARRGRMFILQKMMEVIDRPRPDISPYAPRMFTITVPVEKIKDVIGPGGKTINKIIAETGVKIDIEEDGRVFIAAESNESGQRAIEMINEVTRDVVVGDIYYGTVTRTEKYGAFVDILPGKGGLVHISELAEGRVARTEDVAKVGDKIWVKVTGIDRMGRINLSRKQALRQRKSEQGQQPSQQDSKRDE